MGNFVSTHFLWVNEVIEVSNDSRKLISFLYKQLDTFLHSNTQLLNPVTFRVPLKYLTSITAKHYAMSPQFSDLQVDKKTQAVTAREFIGTSPALQSIPAGPANEVSILTYRHFKMHFSLIGKINKNLEFMSLLNSNKPIIGCLIGKPSALYVKPEQEEYLALLETAHAGQLDPYWFDKEMKAETAFQLLQLFHEFDVSLYKSFKSEFPSFYPTTSFTVEQMEDQFYQLETLTNNNGNPLIFNLQWGCESSSPNAPHVPSPRERLGEIGYVFLVLAEAVNLDMDEDEKRRRLIVCCDFGVFEADGCVPSSYGLEN